MVTTLAQRLEAFLSCCREGKTILSKDEQLDVVKMHKRIRSRDYVFNFDLHGANDFKRVANTTSAGWFFFAYRRGRVFRRSFARAISQNRHKVPDARH